MKHDALRELARLAARQYGLRTTEQAYRAGLTKRHIVRRVETGHWIPVAKTVYLVAGAPHHPRQALLAHILAGGPGTVASHRAAAALWRLPGFDEGVVEVSKPRGRSQRIATGRIHGSLWLPAHHVTTVEGVPATTPPRTIFDIAGWLHPKRVKRAFENAINMDLVTPLRQAALVAELGKRGRRGTALMRKLCESHGIGYVAPASELEALLLEVLAGAGLPPPDQQVDLGDEEDWIGRVDFYYRDAKLVLEADGRRYHHQEDDAARDARFEVAGLRVLRVTWEQLVNRPEEVAATTANLL